MVQIDKNNNVYICQDISSGGFYILKTGKVSKENFKTFEDALSTYRNSKIQFINIVNGD